MDIYSLALWSSLATQGTVNTSNSIGNNLSFSKLLSEAKIKENMTVEDMLSVAFPTCDVNMKVGECNVPDNLWQRKDFPVWKYFREDVSADILNDWKPRGKEPTGKESYLQKELKAVGNGKVEVLMPESLRQKMEEDPEYAKQIVTRLQRWKLDYDRTDNAIAASYGYNSSQYQMSKSYCLQLNENGNVENYTVISGGKNGKEISTEESAAEDKLELQNRIIQNMKYRMMMAPFQNGMMGNLGMSGLDSYQTSLYSSIFGTLF